MILTTNGRLPVTNSKLVNYKSYLSPGALVPKIWLRPDTFNLAGEGETFTNQYGNVKESFTWQNKVDGENIAGGWYNAAFGTSPFSTDSKIFTGGFALYLSEPQKAYFRPNGAFTYFLVLNLDLKPNEPKMVYYSNQPPSQRKTLISWKYGYGANDYIKISVEYLPLNLMNGTEEGTNEERRFVTIQQGGQSLAFKQFPLLKKQNIVLAISDISRNESIQMPINIGGSLNVSINSQFATSAETGSTGTPIPNWLLGGIGGGSGEENPDNAFTWNLGHDFVLNDGGFFDGYLAEMIYYDKGLIQSQIKAISDGLMAKYNITA